ncbi:MAG: autotransporter outer membrane beta-barrel domain-containing protein [Phycisphaerae bacterium]
MIVSNANAFGSGAVVVNSGSTLETSGALAQSGSTMAVNAGSYTQQANSTLALLVTSSSTTVGGSTNDSVSLGSGNASLAGNVNLVFANGSAPVKNAVYEVITTTGSVSGTQSVTLTGPGLTGAPTNLHGFASFDSGVGEIVTLETQYFANFTGLTPNETAVANYLNTNAIGPNTSPAVAAVLNTVAGQSTSQQAAFLDSVTPQAYGQLEQQAIQNNIFLAQQVFEQVENAFDYGGWNTSGLTVLKTGQQDPFTVSLDAEMESAKQQAQNSALSMDAAAVPTSGAASQRNRFSGYVLGTITVDQLPENSGFPSQHFTTGSLLAGLDYRLTRNLMVGAIFNWGYTGATLDSYGSRQQSSSYTPGLVIGYKKKGFYANGLMSYTYNSYKINRNVASTTATGEPKSNEYDANLLTGYYFHVAKGLKAGPAVGLGYSHVNTGGSSETGSPFDLTMGSQNTDSLRSLAGMQALYTFMPPHISLPISVNFNAFWQHEYLNTSRAITSSFTQLGGGSFLYNTPAPSRDSALLGLGASGYLTKNMSLFVNYETQIGDHNQFAQTVMAGVALRF